MHNISKIKLSISAGLTAAFLLSIGRYPVSPRNLFFIPDFVINIQDKETNSDEISTIKIDNTETCFYFVELLEKIFS